MKQTKKNEEKLNAIKRSRPRELLPRPVRFRDRTKFSRTEEKSILRKIKKEEAKDA